MRLFTFVKICFFPKLLSTMSTQAANCMSSNPQRFQNVEGYDRRKNDIIYHSSISERPSGIVVFFGGDVQDYTENMMSHRDNKIHVKWNLENTAMLLHRRFPTSDIFIVRPSRMHLKTFSCYENFVEGNDFGAPNHKITIDALKHLKLLLQNVLLSVNLQCSAVSTNLNYEPEVQLDSSLKNNCEGKNRSELPISLVGFSKGCVVLNQLLYAFMALSQSPDEDLISFVKRIKVIYWLDGGHSGSCDTWVTNKAILQNFANLKIKIRIHVTPYQMFCETRPRIGKEEKIFREILRRLQCDIQRTLYFEDDSRSFENHFKVLEEFNISD